MKVRGDRAPQRTKRTNRPGAHLDWSRDVLSLFHGSTKVLPAVSLYLQWPSSAVGSAAQTFCSLSICSEVSREPCTDCVGLEFSAKCFADLQKAVAGPGAAAEPQPPVLMAPVQPGPARGPCCEALVVCSSCPICW